MVSALFKALISYSANFREGLLLASCQRLVGQDAPSQLLLHLPAQQQGGRLQATLVLGLQPNHTKGLGREAPCSGTWQSGLGGGREEVVVYGTGVDDSGYPGSFLLIPA